MFKLKLYIAITFGLPITIATYGLYRYSMSGSDDGLNYLVLAIALLLAFALLDDVILPSLIKDRSKSSS